MTGPYGLTAHGMRGGARYRAAHVLAALVVAACVAACVGFVAGRHFAPSHAPAPVGEKEGVVLTILAQRIGALSDEIAAEDGNADVLVVRCGGLLERYDGLTGRFSLGELTRAGIPLPDTTWCAGGR